MRYKVAVGLLLAVIGVSLLIHLVFDIKTIIQKQAPASIVMKEVEKAYSEGYAKGYSSGTKAFLRNAAQADPQRELPDELEVITVLAAAEDRILKFEAEYASMAKGYNDLVSGYNKSLEKTRVIRDKALSSPTSDPMAAISFTFEEVGALNEALKYANTLIKKNNELMSKTMEQLNATYVCMEEISEKLAETGVAPDKAGSSK